MSEGPMQRWLGALLSMTSSAEETGRYLDARHRFATAVASALLHRDPRCDPLVYGVWLVGHGEPVYVGQTTGGARRLWDLPIGESHHLANSFPPEIWERVVVVYWKNVLEATPRLEKRLLGRIQPLFESQDDSPSRAIGLGLEYLIQQRTQPLFNGRKRKRDGNWRSVNWMSSASLGAHVAPYLAELFEPVWKEWSRLAEIPGPTEEGISATTEHGRVVFPQRLHRSVDPVAPETVGDR